MYLSITGPNIAFDICLLSKFMIGSKSSYMAATKRVLRYMKGTTNLEVFYRRDTGDSKGELEVYTDNDYVSDIEDRRSTSRYVFF